MSDDIKKYVVPFRKVERAAEAKLYYVLEFDGEKWFRISKGFAHSTSAYAKLGRITHNESVSYRTISTGSSQ